jgi:methionyl-tRNA formyltransferase
MRLIFAGTPQFALPTLRILQEDHDVAAVVTQAPQKAHRGQKETLSPIHEYAIAHGLPVSTEPINKLENALRAYAPECMVITAYGEILAPNILAIPKKGVINIHPSLLPKYRGASPMQATLLAGERETGVTLIQMVEKMDAGPIIAQEILAISSDETAGTLHDKLAHLGARLLRDVLACQLEHPLSFIPQDESKATYTYKIKSEDAEIRANDSSFAIERKIRAYNPWPGVYLEIENPHIGAKRLKIFRSQIKKELPPLPSTSRYDPFHIIGGHLFFATGDRQPLLITEVQPEGKKRMSGEEFVRGYMRD